MILNSQSIITNRNTKFLPAWGPAVHHAHEVTTVKVETDFPKSVAVPALQETLQVPLNVRQKAPVQSIDMHFIVQI